MANQIKSKTKGKSLCLYIDLNGYLPFPNKIVYIHRSILDFIKKRKKKYFLKTKSILAFSKKRKKNFLNGRARFFLHNKKKILAHFVPNFIGYIIEKFTKLTLLENK